MMPNSSWDPFGSRDKWASMWSLADVPTLSSRADSGYRALLSTIRRLVVGRTLAVDLDGRELALTITKMDSEVELLGLTVGQFGDVMIEAADIECGGYRCQRAAAVLHNVHYRPSTQSLVAAPVDLEVELPTDVIDGLIRRTMSRLTGDVGADGIARLRLRHHPESGHVEVSLGVRAGVIRLTPRVLVLRRRRWTLPARLPAYPLPLPDLPQGILIRSIAAWPNSLLIRGVLPEWRIAVPRRTLDDVVGQLSTTGDVLNLARSAWHL